MLPALVSLCEGKQKLVLLHHQPAGQTASSGPSPRLFPPLEGSAGAAGGNNAASVQTSPVSQLNEQLIIHLCWVLYLQLGGQPRRCSPSPCKTTNWFNQKNRTECRRLLFSYQDVNTHRASAFFSEKIRTRKSASWWGWKVVGTSRYFPGGSVKRSDTSRMLM